jgi:hypothetical protein
MTLLPALSPGFVAGFAAGTLLSAVCLLFVISVQWAGRQRTHLPRLSLRRPRLAAIRWRRTARRRAGRSGPAPEEPHPSSAPAGPADVPMPLPRGGRHAAPAGGNVRMPGRRRSRLLTTRD